MSEDNEIEICNGSYRFDDECQENKKKVLL